MDVIRALADHSIRRACGFAGLGVFVTMLALSYDIVLTLRTGAALTAMGCLALAAIAWHAPRRDMRRTELWVLLTHAASDVVRRMPRARAQALLSGILRERLLWHAERVGLIAMVLWALMLLAALVMRG